MTVQRQRPRGVPRPRPVGERRRSVVYGIPTLPVDKRTGKVIPGAPPVVGYIGKSVQTVWERQEQHRTDQPFSDLICGGSWPIEEGYWTAAELDAREQWWIRNGAVLVAGQQPQRPVYNYEFNTDNPDRIEVWRAKEHRQAREPGWQPGKSSPRAAVRSQRPWAQACGWVWSAVKSAAANPRQVKAALWVGLWLAAAWVVGRQAAAGPVATWVDGVVYGSGFATVLVGVLLPGKRRRRRRWRSRRR
ncbi:hypothetical protein [Micromonospora sp. NPDC049891]|uniref:hypothetical protein n=1 Tax=Micromonospora sp. NPDC049891 TaxID=3155655 RepID=UPI0033C24FBB